MTANPKLKKTSVKTRTMGPAPRKRKAKPPKKSRRELPAPPKRGCVETKYNARRHDLFMTALMEKAVVYVACKAAGISRATAYNWRKEVSDFAVEWDDIMAGRMEELESSVFKRAKDGVVEDIYYKGDVVGQVRKPSDTLAIFLLRANNPGKYDRGKGITMEGTGEFSLSINDQDKEITAGVS